MIADKYNRINIDKLPKELATELEEIKTGTENFSDEDLIEVYKDNFNDLFKIIENKHPEALKAKKKLIKPVKVKIKKPASAKKKLVKKAESKKVLKKSSDGEGRGFSGYEKGKKITQSDVFDLKVGDIILAESDDKTIKNAYIVKKAATKEKPKVEINYIKEPKQKDDIVWWANIMAASNFYFAKKQSDKKVKLDKITIFWAEGDNSQYDKFPKDYKTWEDAHKAIIPIYEDTIKDDFGGYNKTKFKVVFKDGEDYEGRLDVSEKEDNPTQTSNVIGQHIKDFLDYQLSEKSQTSESSKSEIKEWLNKYDLGLEKESASTDCDDAIETIKEIEKKKADAAKKRAEAPKKKASTAAEEKQVKTIASLLKTKDFKTSKENATNFANDLVAVYKKYNLKSIAEKLQKDIDDLIKEKYKS